ncbi:MAG: hypothetical protein WKF77_24435 [Planctomycetaceae bacterium]
MAGSDKNAARSVAGGNSTQPAQPVSKAEGSAVAGQLLTTLKTSESKPAAGHEARLGIMVITILVFAFGFLVYHKMDVHQQNMTKAAIAPAGTTPPDAPQANPIAGIISQESLTAASDPLVNLADLSDGSPFADSAVVLADPATENQSITESFDTLGEPALSQPRGSRQVRETPAPEFASSDVPQLEPNGDATTLMVDPSASLPDLTVSDTRETELPEFAVTSEMPAMTNSASSILESAPAFQDIEEKPVTVQSEASGEPPTSNEMSFGLAADEPTFSEPEPDQEPVLLALAAPQQSSGFANGFLQDDSGPTAKAPLEEPTEISSFPPYLLNKRPTPPCRNKARIRVASMP